MIRSSVESESILESVYSAIAIMCINLSNVKRRIICISNYIRIYVAVVHHYGIGQLSMGNIAIATAGEQN